jgi:hypothetical protein
MDRRVNFLIVACVLASFLVGFFTGGAFLPPATRAPLSQVLVVTPAATRASLSQALIVTPSSAPPAPPPAPSLKPSFLELGRKHQTDKVTGHHYDVVYTDLLEPWRQKPAGRFLEIGIGCGMYKTSAISSEGHSLALWLEYFPPGWIITSLEYDAACVASFVARDPYGWGNATWEARVRLITGSQSEPADLARVHEAGGPFDLVVDDGGHSYKMQITSFVTLFPLLPPGAVYVVEDLGPNSLWGRDTVQYNDWGVTMVAFLDVVMHFVLDVTWQPPGVTGPFPHPAAAPGAQPLDAHAAAALYKGAEAVARSVLSIECFVEVCVIRKCPDDNSRNCGRM